MSSVADGHFAALESHQAASAGIDFLAGGGEMGARMRALDWSATPLGPTSHWPQSLKTIVRVMLDSRYAMWMLWGPELTFFCNDAYLPTVGVKRDWVLGARSDKVWEEIWPDIGPRIAQVLEQGRATWDEALLFFEWFGAAIDVTERKQTEQALREREEQLRLATDAAEIGLWDVDMITDTLYWPPRVKAMFGISPDVPVSMADFYSGLHPHKQLVELHGGTVQANSDGHGNGSVFTVRLPVLKMHSATRGDTEPVASDALSGMRILAVEDDAAMLEVLTRVLTEYGAKLTSVPSAAAALEALSGPQRFDLLLSDIGLPGMDGYELVRAVRKDYRAEDLPAIAVTAFSREKDRALAAESGFQAYLTKPYEVVQIVGLARKFRRARAS